MSILEISTNFAGINRPVVKKNTSVWMEKSPTGAVAAQTAIPLPGVFNEGTVIINMAVNYALHTDPITKDVTVLPPAGAFLVVLNGYVPKFYDVQVIQAAAGPHLWANTTSPAITTGIQNLTLVWTTPVADPTLGGVPIPIPAGSIVLGGTDAGLYVAYGYYTTAYNSNADANTVETIGQIQVFLKTDFDKYVLYQSLTQTTPLVGGALGKPLQEPSYISVISSAVEPNPVYLSTTFLAVA